MLIEGKSRCRNMDPLLFWYPHWLLICQFSFVLCYPNSSFLTYWDYTRFNLFKSGRMILIRHHFEIWASLWVPTVFVFFAIFLQILVFFWKIFVFSMTSLISLMITLSVDYFCRFQPCNGIMWFLWNVVICQNSEITDIFCSVYEYWQVWVLQYPNNASSEGSQQNSRLGLAAFYSISLY